MRRRRAPRKVARRRARILPNSPPGVGSGARPPTGRGGCLIILGAAFAVPHPDALSPYPAFVYAHTSDDAPRCGLPFAGGPSPLGPARSVLTSESANFS